MAGRRPAPRGARTGSARGATRSSQRSTTRSNQRHIPRHTPGNAPGNLRPGQRGGGRSTPAGSARPRPRFTNRMAVLVVVLAVLVVSYASSMRAYLQQRSQINELRGQIAASERTIGSLQKEKKRWNDKAYVETQARERFGWVLPGETSYQVIGRDGKPLDSPDELAQPGSVARQVPQSWWGKVYGTLEAADHPKKAPVPATRITPPRSSSHQ